MTKIILIFAAVSIGCGSDPTGPNGQKIEVQTKIDDNGNISSKFQYYWEGALAIKHGWYKAYNENGILVSLQNYYEDKLNGRWIKYYSDGQIEIKGNYKNGYRDGKWVEYNSNENVSKKYCYYDGHMQNDMSRCENKSPKEVWEAIVQGDTKN